MQFLNGNTIEGFAFSQENFNMKTVQAQLPARTIFNIGLIIARRCAYLSEIRFNKKHTYFDR